MIIVSPKYMENANACSNNHINNNNFYYYNNNNENGLTQIMLYLRFWNKFKTKFTFLKLNLLQLKETLLLLKLKFSLNTT